MSNATLRALLAPMTETEFFEKYFERNARAITDRAPSAFDDIMSLSSFEDLARTVQAGGRQQCMMIAQDGRATPVAPPILDRDGFVVQSELFRAYQDGSTIILNHLQRRSQAVRRLCLGLREAIETSGAVRLRGGIVANAYLTPSGGRAFGAHYDDHNVLVLQVDGTKVWQVYGGFARATYASQDALAEDTLGDPIIEIEMRPGDVLYMPPRFPHRAKSATRHSLHLSLGFSAITHLDVLNVLIHKKPGLWSSIKVSGNDDWSARAAQRIIEDLPDLGGDIADALRSISYVDSPITGTVPEGCIARINGAGRTTLDTRIAPAAEAAVTVAGPSAFLSINESVLRLPAAFAPALAAFVHTAPLSVRDLPMASDADKVSLAKRLIAFGAAQEQII